MKKLLKNGMVVLEDRMEKASIMIEDGRILAVYGEGETVDPGGCQVIQADGKIVMPGMIDTHNHMCDPGPYNFREDWSCGSRSAASGGITTICDMPLPCEPEVLDEKTFTGKAQAVAPQSVVDYAFWAGFTPKNLEELERLHKTGAIGFKGFMCFATDSYPRITDAAMVDGFRTLAGFDGLAALHCENAEVAAAGQEHYSRIHCEDEACFDDARPWWVEYDAVQRAVLFAQETGARLEICHLSSVQAAEFLKSKKAQGNRLYVETCPHYLIFDKEVLRKVKSFGKCTPPFRSRENVDKLWDYVFDGTIDVIGSDHGPFTDEEKVEKQDFWKEYCGFGCNDVMLAALITEGVHKRGMSWNRLARLTSGNAARMLGLYPRKGVIAPGADADIILIDPDKEWTYDGTQSFSKTKSDKGVYQGFRLKGCITDTYVRGELVYHEGEIRAFDGYGKLVKPVQ